MDSAKRDRIIAKERRRFRNRIIFTVLGVIVAELGIPLSMMAERHAPLPRFLLAFPPLGMFIMGGAGLLIAAFGAGLNHPPSGADFPEVVERQIETIQNRHRWLLVLLATIVLFFAAEVTVLPHAWPDFFGTAGRPEPGMVWLYVIMVVCALPLVFIGFHRPGLDTYHGVNINDELSRDLRLQAIRIGYAAIMLAVAGSYAWFLLQPSDIGEVLPWILAGGIAVPALSFALLHWRAGRDG